MTAASASTAIFPSVVTQDICVTRSAGRIQFQLPRLVSGEHLLAIVWQLRNECPVHGHAATDIIVDISAVNNPPSALLVVLEALGQELCRQGHEFTIRGKP